MSAVIDIIRSEDETVRNQAIDAWCQDRNLTELSSAAAELEAYRREETNLYHRVRALFFSPHHPSLSLPPPTRAFGFGPGAVSGF